MAERDAATPVKEVIATELPSRAQEQIITHEPYIGTTGGSGVIGAPTVLVKAGAFAAASVGDIVNVKSGTGATVGYYSVVGIGGAPNNVTLNANFVTGPGDASAVVFDVYHELARLQSGILRVKSINADGVAPIIISTAGAAGLTSTAAAATVTGATGAGVTATAGNVVLTASAGQVTLTSPAVSLPIKMAQTLSGGVGAPIADAHVVGEKYTDNNGTIWECVTAGTPGIWTSGVQSRQVTLAHTAFTGLGGVATGQVLVYALPAEAEIVSCFYNCSALFTDAAPPLGNTTIGIGLAGAPASCIQLCTAQRVDDAGAAIGIRGIKGADLNVGTAIYNLGGPTNIMAEITIAGGKFCNALTAGSITVYLSYIIHA